MGERPDCMFSLSNKLTPFFLHIFRWESIHTLASFDPKLSHEMQWYLHTSMHLQNSASSLKLNIFFLILSVQLDVIIALPRLCSTEEEDIQKMWAKVKCHLVLAWSPYILSLQKRTLCECTPDLTVHSVKFLNYPVSNSAYSRQVHGSWNGSQPWYQKLKMFILKAFVHTTHSHVQSMHIKQFHT